MLGGFARAADADSVRIPVDGFIQDAALTEEGLSLGGVAEFTAILCREGVGGELEKVWSMDGTGGPDCADDPPNSGVNIEIRENYFNLLLGGPGQDEIPTSVFGDDEIKLFLFVSINDGDWQLIVQNEGLELHESFLSVNTKMLGGYDADEYLLKSEYKYVFENMDITDLPNFPDANTLRMGESPFSSANSADRYYGMQVYQSDDTSVNPGLYYDRVDNDWKVKVGNGSFESILTSSDSLNIDLASATGLLDASKITGSLSVTSVTAPTIIATLRMRLTETGGGSDTITMQAPSNITSSYTLTFPTSAGTNNYVLTTDGAGTLSWAAQSGGGGG
ncbi:MAG: hypothetical protein HQM16_18360, partial [Deltaproteobacteria bacterium]|nr:hypothetical protein [Deltaproteobacteria bacterium]